MVPVRLRAVLLLVPTPHDCMSPSLGAYPTETRLVLEILSKCPGVSIKGNPWMIIESMPDYCMQLGLIINIHTHLQSYILEIPPGEMSIP